MSMQTIAELVEAVALTTADAGIATYSPTGRHEPGTEVGLQLGPFMRGEGQPGTSIGLMFYGGTTTSLDAGATVEITQPRVQFHASVDGHPLAALRLYDALRALWDRPTRANPLARARGLVGSSREASYAPLGRANPRDADEFTLNIEFAGLRLLATESQGDESP